MVVSCLASISTLKMEATCCSETLVGFQRTTHGYIPEVRILVLSLFESSPTVEIYFKQQLHK
jgi:hypothetical protein